MCQSCLGKNVIIDPTSDEEAWQDGGLMVSYMPARKEITQLTLTGEWTDGKITNVCYLSTALPEMHNFLMFR